MYSIAYLSSASFAFSDDDLATLLMNSRANNRAMQLTGMLLFRDGRFMQVLEGPEHTVRARYSVIAGDPRHRDVRKLYDETYEERQFPDWSMGYPPVTDTMAGVIPGFTDFFGENASRLDLTLQASRARLLLEWFRNQTTSSATVAKAS